MMPILAWILLGLIAGSSAASSFWSAYVIRGTTGPDSNSAQNEHRLQNYYALCRYPLREAHIKTRVGDQQ